MWTLRTIGQALDFTMNRVLIELYKTSNTQLIEECRYFSCQTAVYADSETLQHVSHSCN